MRKQLYVCSHLTACKNQFDSMNCGGRNPQAMTFFQDGGSSFYTQPKGWTCSALHKKVKLSEYNIGPLQLNLFSGEK
uniref:Uncharacterized protein n=1 Tax=viral metagenome TaxID=1070528 RepID=A0A6M3LFX3_9ZZZZ